MSKDELEPIYVDNLVYDALVLYRESDKSFWKWEFLGERPKQKPNLTKVSHYWIDIFLKGAWLSSENPYIRNIEKRAKRRERWEEMKKQKPDTSK